MWRTITLPDEIAAAQRTFQAFLAQNLRKQQFHTIGRQGGSHYREVLTDGDLWYTHRLDDQFKTPKHWNAFGRFGPTPSSIIVEVNIVLSGINRRFGGLFAKEDHGLVALFHRGKIGGGRTGIGQDTFLSWYDARPDNHRLGVDDDSHPLRAILVAPLREADFFPSLRQFVLEVQAFKEEVA